MGQDASNVVSRSIVSKDKVHKLMADELHIGVLVYPSQLRLLTTHWNTACNSQHAQTSKPTHHQHPHFTNISTRRLEKRLQLLPRGSFLLRQLTHHGNGEERGGVNLSKPWVSLSQRLQIFLFTVHILWMIGIHPWKYMQYFFAFWLSEIEAWSGWVIDVLNFPFGVCWQ